MSVCTRAPVVKNEPNKSSVLHSHAPNRLFTRIRADLLRRHREGLPPPTDLNLTAPLDPELRRRQLEEDEANERKLAAQVEKFAREIQQRRHEQSPWRELEKLQRASDCGWTKGWCDLDSGEGGFGDVRCGRWRDSDHAPNGCAFCGELNRRGWLKHMIQELAEHPNAYCALLPPGLKNKNGDDKAVLAAIGRVKRKWQDGADQPQFLTIAQPGGHTLVVAVVPRASCDPPVDIKGFERTDPATVVAKIRTALWQIPPGLSRPVTSSHGWALHARDDSKAISLGTFGKNNTRKLDEFMAHCNIKFGFGDGGDSLDPGDAPKLLRRIWIIVPEEFLTRDCMDNLRGWLERFLDDDIDIDKLPPNGDLRIPYPGKEEDIARRRAARNARTISPTTPEGVGEIARDESPPDPPSPRQGVLPGIGKAKMIHDDASDL
jgi:hypothetical protein